MKVVHLLLLICFFVLTLAVWHQGETITEQRQLIREMTHNPQCLIPKE
jgi:hypothetical protein